MLYIFINIMDPSIFRVRYVLAFRSMVNLFRTPRFGAVMLLTDWDGKERESQILVHLCWTFDFGMP